MYDAGDKASDHGLPHDEATEQERAELAREIGDPYGARYFLARVCLGIMVLSTLFALAAAASVLVDPPAGGWQWIRLAIWTLLVVAALGYGIGGYRYRHVRQWQIRYTAISVTAFAAGIAFIALTTVLG